jgi:predicted  nucleic acid-binding Zn-ribbon protein
VDLGKIKGMLELQRLEIEAENLKSSLEKLKEQERSFLHKLEAIERERDEILKKRELIQKEIREHREHIEECKKNIKKTEERLNMVKKAEEYKALLREKARHEDCVIKLTERLKGLELELKSMDIEGIKEKYGKLIQEVEEEISDIRYSQARLGNRLGELEKRLENFKLSLREGVLKEYENLKRKYGLPFIVPVDAYGVCENCGTKLPSALYSKVIEGGIVSCPSCGRLLYHEEA